MLWIILYYQETIIIILMTMKEGIYKTIIEHIFLKERLTIGKYIMIAVTVAGIIVLGMGDA